MTQPPEPERRPAFVLRLEGQPGTDGIHALRRLLKALLRRHGFRCTEAREESDQ